MDALTGQETPDPTSMSGNPQQPPSRTGRQTTLAFPITLHGMLIFVQHLAYWCCRRRTLLLHSHHWQL